MRNQGLVLFVILVSVSAPLLKPGRAPAAAADSVSSSVDSAIAPADTLQRFGYAFIPAIFYTPETGFAGGASVLLFFRGRNDREIDLPSTVSPTLIFTEKKQIIAVIGYELNLKQSRYRVNGDIGYLEFPDLFYGIGPDTPDDPEDYTPETAFLGVSLKKRIWPRLMFGVRYEFGHSQITETEDGGLLASGLITGSDGGTVSGLGPVITWDSRDRLFYPKTGSFHALSALFYTDGLGSDFVFERYIMDFRTYIPFFEKNILALRAWFSLINGDPPFQMMSTIGGAELMRGYYDGRYRDNNAIVLQAEWRRRLWWRFGASVFAGYGDVAPTLDSFDIAEFKAAAGAGIRFVIDRGEGIAIRMDFGFIGGTPGPYFMINEAF
ncbi:MAG: BamA/TamA family outer membrane protein [Candidatus Latescibacterota bacterium]|nr:MAG: BamA/TamA family outer membrane protein [Candidatus Latescibacterota bacterium]